jgi:hypothetical protein
MRRCHAYHALEMTRAMSIAVIAKFFVGSHQEDGRLR